MRNRIATEKVKISFVLPAALQQDMKEKMIRDGYDLKGKSRWVSEAIESLLKMKTFPELVKLNDEMSGFGKMESVLIPRELKSKLDHAVLKVRQTYLMLEGVQSRLLRTAIMQRLLS